MSDVDGSGGLSIVLPVYNEQDCIKETLRELLGVLRQQPLCFEVLCVDDGSSDNSLCIMQELKGHEMPELRVLQLSRNSGQSAAFGVGFRYAQYPVIVTMDADGQNDPADVPLLVKGLEEGDVCCGYRARRQDTLSKRLASRLGNGIRNAVLGSPIIDTGCSLKAFKADQVRDIPMFTGMHRFLADYCLMRGARVVQRPVNHRPRTRGKSKYTNLGRLCKTLPDLLAVRWMQRRMSRFEVKECM